jgi:transcriptional regulator with XRE-family HTH domain
MALKGAFQMPQKNLLSKDPPYEVAVALRELGSNLRTARLRRRITMEDAAERIGTGVRAVRDAEAGKPTTSIAVYYALLWLYGLILDARTVASPIKDEEGLKLAMSREPKIARAARGGMDNDF